jgi:YfiH family protein
MNDLINAHFRAGLPVAGYMTTRSGGVSSGVYGEQNGGNGLNLGENCGDDPAAVSANRAALQASVGHPISWMKQVHGTHVHVVNSGEMLAVSSKDPVVADAMITTATNHGLGVLTADCLPVLFASESVIGVAHAGWRGLSGGVIGATVSAMNQAGAENEKISVWFGAAIGPTAFEVGVDVVQAFAGTPNHNEYFVSVTGKTEKWWCDLYGLAREQLRSLGVDAIFGGDCCTVSDPTRFFSYRRDGQCGRMAAVVVRTSSQD